MAPSLYIVAAGLLLGQTAEPGSVPADPSQPKCNAARNTVTQVQYVAPDRVSSAPMPVSQKRNVFAPLFERMGHTFGKRPTMMGASTVGTARASVIAPAGHIETAEPQLLPRLPNARVTHNEPPLLEVSVEPAVTPAAHAGVPLPPISR